MIPQRSNRKRYREIITLYETGTPAKIIARDFCISVASVYTIVSRYAIEVESNEESGNDKTTTVDTL